MTRIHDLSRRDFLKLAGAGALGLALTELRLERAFAASPKQGRITLSGIPMYEEPSFNARKLHVFGKDETVTINREADGDPGNPFNKTWYEVNGEGYSYSGWIQPVETVYQKPQFEVPKTGQVGEITVPVCDTRLDPTVYSKRGYRIYYGSTHWVTRVIAVNAEKTIWYEIYDFHARTSYYVAHYEMRLVPAQELSLLSPAVPESEKIIYIDLSTQLVTAYEGETLVFSSRCSSGRKGTRTPEGEFRTYHKGASVHMSNEGDAEANIYSLPGVPWCTFFTSEGVALHGTYWHNDYGKPRSHGCVNLPSAAAKFIYLWTRPHVPPDTQYLHLPGEGTRVNVFYSNT